MTPEQQKQIIDFVGNFVALMYENGHGRDCVEDSVRGAISCVFGVIWNLNPDTCDPAYSDFAGSAIGTSLAMFYGASQKAELQC